jgi:hypothetical protein
MTMLTLLWTLHLVAATFTATVGPVTTVDTFWGPVALSGPADLTPAALTAAALLLAAAVALLRRPAARKA